MENRMIWRAVHQDIPHQELLGFLREKFKSLAGSLLQLSPGQMVTVFIHVKLRMELGIPLRGMFMLLWRVSSLIDLPVQHSNEIEVYVKIAGYSFL